MIWCSDHPTRFGVECLLSSRDSVMLTFQILINFDSAFVHLNDPKNPHYSLCHLVMNWKHTPWSLVVAHVHYVGNIHYVMVLILQCAVSSIPLVVLSASSMALLEA